MKRTKQVKKVKRPHREGGDNDAAWLKADNTVHSLPLPPNLSLPRSLLDSKTLSLYLTVHRRRPITHMPSHSLPHTHAQLDTRLLWVGHFSMPFCLLPPLRPRFRLLSSSHLPFYLSPTFVFAAFSIMNVFRRARLVVAAVSVVCVVVAVFVVCFPPKRYKIVASCIIYCNCRGKNSCFCDTFGGIWSEKSVSRRRSENFQLHFSFFSV